ncbi:OmpA family protein [Aquipuribacter hungaricus]|uniref:OmpA family protein n=1 Tax=Aquipuribacter hungaricus TaxID=545624 RepID=A0ABV7WJM8_9MICO
MSRGRTSGAAGSLLAASAAVAAVSLVLVAAPAWSGSSPEPTGAARTAVPPAAATGDGVVATVDGVTAAVEGVVAEIVPRTASEDGALEQQGDAEFTLAGDVYFDSGSAVLLPRATADLAAVAAQVQEAGVTALQVVGHTDTVGSDESNQVLSEARAASVVAALQPQLPGVTLVAEGRGETELIAAETTEDGQDDPVGRALNRRVTVRPVP